MIIQKIINEWEEKLKDNLIYEKIIPKKAAIYSNWPEGISPILKEKFQEKGIKKLYKHQSQSVKYSINKENVVITTGISSGKSLCYQIPIINDVIQDRNKRSLLLFPTKALAHDQEKKLNELIPDKFKEIIKVASYDGDTPRSKRVKIRDKVQLILTNPDMLHFGIMSNHTKWSEFFENLDFIIIDEIHTYRGIFGSHIANIFRRLKRITKFYKSSPRFIMTSATISNAKSFASKLIESDVRLIEEDFSQRGKKHFLLYNPPLVNKELGIRKNSLLEAVNLAENLIENGLQTLVFGLSRNSVERIVTYLRNKKNIEDSLIEGYRSGYLPNQRREIERKMKSKEILGIIATSALELGIDIGSISATILTSYPGSIAKTWQQAGRSGRNELPSLSVLITSANPINQYLAKNPEFIFSSNSEKVLINPDNLLILYKHIRCAAFELPFNSKENFGSVDYSTVDDFLDVLQQNEEIHKTTDKSFWISDKFPSKDLSLRSSSSNSITLKSITEEKIIGVVDKKSSYILVHKDAVYIHNGESYIVKDLDLSNNQALLLKKNLEYFTVPISDTKISLLEKKKSSKLKNYSKNYGDLQVTSKITGFKKIQWYSHQILGYENLELPETILVTCGCWFSLDAKLVDYLKKMRIIEKNNYGKNWERIKEKTRKRDNFRCQACGAEEIDKKHDVHHIKPFKMFKDKKNANRMENLVTLCKSCHKLAEQNVQVKSGLAGVAYLIRQLAPLSIMCDFTDISVYKSDKLDFSQNLPSIVVYDSAQGGIGLTNEIYSRSNELLQKAYKVVFSCSCDEGCPACVGPVSETGIGAKKASKLILANMLK